MDTLTIISKQYDDAVKLGVFRNCQYRLLILFF